jgi:dihydrofolate synthase / folylpolyglutamate synthase
MNSYKEILEKIFTRTKSLGTNPSLTAINTLCKLYNRPEQAYPVIHVAGTNGKGSVCTKIATSLTLGGYRVGLYTSPHIACYRERIRINNQMISDEETTVLLSDILQTMDKHAISATFFECTTLLAFCYFQKQKVDVAVIETGLGGRWDATNVVTPLVSVITSIGYDHTDILGSSLEQIAKEKAGIIKERVPAVLGPDVPKDIMHQYADQIGARLYQNPHFAKDYDVENTATARLALEVIKTQFPLSDSAVKMGLQAKPPCRFEQLIHNQTVIFDVAHNEHGFEKLLDKLSESFPDKRYRFLVGFSKGKDIQACARVIEKKAYAVHIVDGPHPRLARVNEISPYFTLQKTHIEPSIEQGVKNVLHALKSDVFVIAGSFFIMNDAKKALGMQAPEDPVVSYDHLFTSKSAKGSV